MPESMIREKLAKEIELLPEEKLSEIYEFIHCFRLGFQKSSETQVDDIMEFAGCWKDMPEFSEEIEERRQKAFNRRRNGKENRMPTLSITIDQIAEMIGSMTDGEKETLLIMLDKAFYQELKKRVEEMPEIVKSGKALSMKEVFDDV